MFLNLCGSFGFRVVAVNNRQNWLVMTPNMGLNPSKCAISTTELMFTTQDPEEPNLFNQRRDYLHRLSYCWTHENQVILLETLNVKGLVKNGRLAQSISSVT